MVSTLREEIRACGGISKQLGLEFILATVFSIIMAFLTYHIKIVPSTGIFTALFTSSAAMLGLIIASYSLILNAGTNDFKAIFYRHDSFRQLRITFSLTSIILGVAILTSIIVTIFHSIIPTDWFAVAIVTTLLPCLWGVFNIIMLVSNAMRMIGEILSNS